jgi:hypothetical protein
MMLEISSSMALISRSVSVCPQQGLLPHGSCLRHASSQLHLQLISRLAAVSRTRAISPNTNALITRTP